MNNLLSYCGLVDAKIRASDIDLPVQRRVAFSRIDRDRKEYVQDLIEQDCAQVYDLISNHQAHIYICGKVIFYVL